MADQDTSLTLAFAITVGDQDAGTQEFDQEMVTIGKGAAAVLQIEDPALADLHAAVQLGDDDAVTLLDLGSESGTLLNGNAINNEPVKDGDEIRIGNTVLVLGVRRPVPEAPAETDSTDDGLTEEVENPALDTHHRVANAEIGEAEDVMEFILRAGTAESDLGIDRRAPQILEVAEIWSGTVMNVQHFSKDAKAVYVGDRRSRTFRIASGTLVSILLFGTAFFMLKHTTLPAPPRYPALEEDRVAKLSLEAEATDLDAIEKWEGEVAEEKAALVAEKRQARAAEKREVELEADRRIQEKGRTFERKAKDKLSDEQKENPETKKTLADFVRVVRDEVIEEIEEEREKAIEEEEKKNAPQDHYLEFKRAWTEDVKTRFEKAVKKNTDFSIALVPPQFDLYERADYEDFIAQKMIPTAELLAPKGKLSKSYMDEFDQFTKEYDRFDDLQEKRVVEDLVLGTRIMRADKTDEVLMLYAGFDVEKVYGVTLEGETVIVPGDEEVFVWDPNAEQIQRRSQMFQQIQEVLYINAKARRSTGGKCEALPKLMDFPEGKRNFEYNAQYSRCLANKSEWEKAREFVDMALDNVPADLTGEPGDDYLVVMQVKARLAQRDAFDGDPLTHGTSLIDEGKRLESQRIHEELRQWILDNRRAPGTLKTVDTGIYQLGKEELKAKQSEQVQSAFWLALCIVFLLPIGFGIDEVRSRKMAQDFFINSENLPSDHFAIVEQDSGAVTVNFTEDSVGFLEKDGEKTTTTDLVGSGRAKEVGGYYAVELADEERFVNDVGHMVFFIHKVFRPKLAPMGTLKNVDWLFLGVLIGLLFLGGTFGVVLATRPYDPSQEVITIPDRFVELMVQQVEKEKEKKQKSSGNPDAGEGAKAKDEEGKVGKKEHKLKKAKGSKVAIQKSQLDKQIAESTGLLADLNQMTDSSIFGTGGLDNQISSALGGLIGSQYGNQYGSGGLGSRGSGYGGGGTAAGLGGLGTRGSGLGASGYGRGSGFYGKKGGGSPGVGAGDPIILGALDKSLIDRVVKSHLAQIRYCYQRELAKNPKLFGKIVVKFVISKDGAVSSATTKSSTMKNPIVEQCVNARFLRMRFPKPKGGGIVIVSYPFVFNASGG
jgi:hypothetical protein